MEIYNPKTAEVYDRDDLFENFSLEDMQALFAYQEGLFEEYGEHGIDKLIAAPISEKFKGKYPDEHKIVTHTVETWDNERFMIDGEIYTSEDLIYDDDLVVKLQAKRDAFIHSIGRQTTEEKADIFAEAMRARMNTIAYIFWEHRFVDPKNYNSIQDNEDQLGTVG